MFLNETFVTKYKIYKFYSNNIIRHTNIIIKLDNLYNTKLY